MERFYLSSEAERIGAGRELRRAAARGELTRIASGIYVDSADWAALGRDERYLRLVHAVSARHSDEQLSHDSAAALWQLPGLGSWPARVHVTADRDDSRRSTSLLLRHRLGRDDGGLNLGGLPVTSLARTIVDIARTAPFARAVGMADAALRGAPHRAPVTKDDLLSCLWRSPHPSGRARVLGVIDFADERAETLGESLSRTQFHALGLPRPQLQRVFSDDQGDMAVDFYFREFDLVAEFDGDKKYLRTRQFHPELSEVEIVLAEKRRENRLRRQVGDVMRVEWREALDRRRLAHLLRAHGISV